MPVTVMQSGNLAQGLSQTELEERLRLAEHDALSWWTVHVLARNRVEIRGIPIGELVPKPTRLHRDSVLVP
eukprot:2546429-Rhodomonas_salina.2